MLLKRTRHIYIYVYIYIYIYIYTHIYTYTYNVVNVQWISNINTDKTWYQNLSSIRISNGLIAAEKKSLASNCIVATYGSEASIWNHFFCVLQCSNKERFTT